MQIDCVIGWFIVLTTLSGQLGIARTYEMIGKDIMQNALYTGLIRIGWAIGTAILILLCHTGKAGYINKFLSLRFWVPLGKLGLSIYLLHPVIQHNIQVSREIKTETNFEIIYILEKYVHDLIIILPSTIVLFFCQWNCHLILQERVFLNLKYLKRQMIRNIARNLKPVSMNSTKKSYVNDIFIYFIDK